MDARINPTRQACDDVTAYQERSRIYRGMSFSRDEIAQAWSAFKAHVDMLDAAVALVLQEFDAERQTSCKAACEVVAESALRLSAREEPQQIATLTGSLASTFAVHLARRPRV
jgi:hypothetical protein